ncbi:uncharacterized protein BX663DRAFT_506748 [Cokeromyces recurvatus]|uniref:uncharacterized protein n=1 Tax=Cokeromyces recurvatus TaxID=90255 RepID=UPI00221FB482|nr:uncharacterized protein BX663DRAFT_506748 [Cokeromyces recurvatus]KAI7903523.1 hypothetical protein BX663DRAFT_506748 [Cokeromyces recurvatus]
MFRSLSFIVSTLLTLSTFTYAMPRMLFPDAPVVDNIDQCRGNGWENDVLTRFTGIFFGDFYTGNAKSISGSLAVQGSFHAPNYVINANHGADCSNLNSFNSYGLVVGSLVDTFNTRVHGSAYIAGGGNIEEILQLDDGCIVTGQQGTGFFNFTTVNELLIDSNRRFADFQPTLILDESGGLLTLSGSELLNYEVVTFHSCNGFTCSQYFSLESDASAILFGDTFWNGVLETEINPDKTYILNIPVLNGDIVILDGFNTIRGFNPCKIILNLYPVDENGRYLSTGEFTLLRRTAYQLSGFILAPRGHIVDGSVGSFSGSIIGLDYTWENINVGVDIQDYHSSGGMCDQYMGCIPTHQDSTPLTPIRALNPNTTTVARTATWSTTYLSHDMNTNPVLTYNAMATNTNRHNTPSSPTHVISRKKGRKDSDKYLKKHAGHRHGPNDECYEDSDDEDNDDDDDEEEDDD